MEDAAAKMQAVNRKQYRKCKAPPGNNMATQKTPGDRKASAEKHRPRPSKTHALLGLLPFFKINDVMKNSINFIAVTIVNHIGASPITFRTASDTMT